MIAIIEIGKRRTVLEAKSGLLALEEAKKILNSPKNKKKSCNVMFTEITNSFTITKQKEN